MTKISDDVKIIVMSVGPYAENLTAKYLAGIGGGKDVVVVLPSCFSDNKEGYLDAGLDVYVYDEKKYINDDFEFFGFKKRNCGGVGRQGVAEAIDFYKEKDSADIFYVLDDDYRKLRVLRFVDGKVNRAVISDIKDLKNVVLSLFRFYERTGIFLAGCLVNLPPDAGRVFTSRKIFNNFLMFNGGRFNYDGFKALTNDDYRYNFFMNFFNATPFLSLQSFQIEMNKSQGVRKDGNAVLYNSDLSWKKAYALRLMNPVASTLYLKKIENGSWQFKEKLRSSLIYPPILVRDDESGKIVGVVGRTFV